MKVIATSIHNKKITKTLFFCLTIAIGTCVGMPEGTSTVETSKLVSAQGQPTEITKTISKENLEQQELAAKILKLRAETVQALAAAAKMDAESGKNKAEKFKLFKEIFLTSPKTIIITALASVIITGGIIYSITGLNPTKKVLEKSGALVSDSAGAFIGGALKEIGQNLPNKEDIMIVAEIAGKGTAQVAGAAARGLLSEALKEAVVFPTEVFASTGEKLGHEICVGVYGENKDCQILQATSKYTMGSAGTTVWPILAYLAYVKYIAIAAAA